MNKSNHEWLNHKPFGDDLWLNMLIDGELSVSQRQAYMAHVSIANDWQKVATAFLDEQVLGTHLAASDDTMANVPVAEAVERPSAGRWMQYLAMAACLVCGLLLGPWLKDDQLPVEVVEVSTPTESQDHEVIHVTEETFQPSLPGLFQVSNTIDEAVYYADFSLPQFMLDALVLAGHQVTLDQEFLGYTETSDNPAAVPINVIRIQKYGRLLAAAQ